MDDDLCIRPLDRIIVFKLFDLIPVVMECDDFVLEYTFVKYHGEPMG